MLLPPQGQHEKRIFHIFPFNMILSLVAVVFAFFFCWSPFHTQRLMFVLVTLYGEWTETLKSVQHILFTISGEERHYINSQTIRLSLWI